MDKRAFFWILIALFVISLSVLAWVLIKSYQVQHQVIGLDFELKIYIWEEFIPEEVIQGFEEEYSVNLIVDTFEDEDQIITVLQEDPGAYDVIFPSGSLLTELIDYRLVSRINHENIPNFTNLMERFHNPFYDSGSRYSVLYDYGFTPLVYNTKYVSSLEGWQDLTDPRFQSKVVLLNNGYEVIAPVLLELGYEITEDDPEAFAEAEDVLARIIANGATVEDPIDIRDQLIEEEIWIGHLYNGEAVLAKEENPSLEVLIPESGALAFYDVMAVSAGTMRQQTAEAFINYILRPDVHAAVTNYTSYANPNQASHDAGLIDEEQLSNPFVYPSENQWEKLVSWGDAILEDSLYVRTWSRLLLRLDR